MQVMNNYKNNNIARKKRKVRMEIHNLRLAHLCDFIIWLLYRSSVVIIAIFTLLCLYFRLSRRFSSRSRQQRKSLAFFHPYCDSGGGGERVLWMMVQAILKSESLSHLDIIVYTGDIGTSKDKIIENVKKKFGISYDATKAANRIHFVYIRSRSLLEAKCYPVATMVGQSIGSILVGFECFLRCSPNYYVDTTGAPFTYPLAKYISGCDLILAYVHYPIISKDMIERVRQMRPDHNNNSYISSSITVSAAKVLYYRIFSFFFSLAGACANHVMVNGTWTCDHISSLWSLAETKISILESDTKAGGVKKAGRRQENSNLLPPSSPSPSFTPQEIGIMSRRLVKIYPPCDFSAHAGYSLKQRQRFILSIGQFRPEKDHLLQIKSFKEFRVRDISQSFKDVKLVLLGGARHQEDKDLVDKLKLEVVNMGLSLGNDVEFVVNASYEELCNRLATASVGIHTMWNEHFGISVVEMMAAGMIVCAHNTAGPKLDIVVPFESQQTGYLADSPSSYAAQMLAAFSMSEAKALKMRIAARASAQRFSDESFIKLVEQELNLSIR